MAAACLLVPRGSNCPCRSSDPVAQGPLSLCAGRPWWWAGPFCISLRVWAKSRCSFHFEKYEYCVAFCGEPVTVPWAAPLRPTAGTQGGSEIALWIAQMMVKWLFFKSLLNAYFNRDTIYIQIVSVYNPIYTKLLDRFFSKFGCYVRDGLAENTGHEVYKKLKFSGSWGQS